jgi:hypothetical protein
MITSQQANAILTTVARYRISEHLMARELYAPGRVTHGAAHQCERASNVHTRVNSLIEWTSETRPTQADLDPAMTAIDAALVQMNIHVHSPLQTARSRSRS